MLRNFLATQIALMCIAFLLATLLLTGAVAGQDTSSKDSSRAGSAPPTDPPIESQEAKSDESNDLESLPAWVSKGSYVADDNSAILVARTAEPFITESEADSAIDQAIRETIAAHFSKTFQSNEGQLNRTGIEFNELDLLVPHTRIVRPFQSAELDERFGRQGCTYYRGYAQLRIDNDLLQSTRTALKRQKVSSRLKFAGLLGAGLIGILGVLFGYLRIDHATRGFYNRRLQTVTIVVIIAIVAAICFACLSLNP
jgi:hypothetical protein